MYWLLVLKLEDKKRFSTKYKEKQNDRLKNTDLAIRFNKYNLLMYSYENT